MVRKGLNCRIVGIILLLKALQEIKIKIKKKRKNPKNLGKWKER